MPVEGNAVDEPGTHRRIVAQGDVVWRAERITRRERAPRP
jgi:hypothetical protein